MAELPCGRTEMCTPCTEINSKDVNTVCRAVGYITGLPQPEDYSDDDIHKITLRHMRTAVMDDGYVTPEMREAAVDSVIELVR